MRNENRKNLIDLIKSSILLYNAGHFSYSTLKKNENVFHEVKKYREYLKASSELLPRGSSSTETEAKTKLAGTWKPEESPEFSQKGIKGSAGMEGKTPALLYCDDGITHTRDPHKFKAYMELVACIRTCKKCPLWEKKKNYVPGEGNLDADIMFVGEAPGAEEDSQGRPFVGKAGQLLTQMLNILGVDRKSVYIGNVLKCRPPGNRDPKPNEIIACLPYLRKQIEIIKPKVICTLGNFSTKSLLGLDVGITKLRGKVYKYRNSSIILVPTYHPSAALRNPSLKDRIIEDIRLALREARIARDSKKGE